MLGKVFLLLSLIDFVVTGSLSDVTSTTFGSNKKGQVAAFGDFDADKDTDIFIISDDGHDVLLYLTSIENPFQEKKLITIPADGTTVSSVVPADFDGDAQMDVFVTLKKQGSNVDVTGQIYWGSSTEVKVESTPLDIHTSFADQPMILDVNGDMIPDLMGETTNGTRFYWLFSKSERNYTMVPVTNGTSTVPLPRLRVPQSSAFVDLNGDLTPDLCVVSEVNGVQQLEYWLNVNGVLTWVKNIPLPAGLKLYGQLAFVDLGTSDSQIDILLPACEDDNCDKSALYYLAVSEWLKLPVSFTFNGKTWGFVPPTQNPGNAYIPVTLRAGDYNLDGFPDLLGVLRSKDQNGNATQMAFIFENIACSTPDCASAGRTFQISYESSLHTATEKALLPAFFDYTENGILDIIITTYANDQNSHIHLLKHKFTDDASFLKVMVVSGLCYGNCPNNREPYGVNQYGPVSFYSTQDTEGKTKTGIASQLTQSAYFSLHLPFTVFGLGQTPNFVDTLKVGISHPEDTMPRNKSWLSIIPNSQLIIIPYPNDSPNSWINKLFVTPSMLVLLTGATLLGTCGFIAGIVGILHWREKVEDRKEKLQEAHKFHFDAM